MQLKFPSNSVEISSTNQLNEGTIPRVIDIRIQQHDARVKREKASNGGSLHYYKWGEPFKDQKLKTHAESAFNLILKYKAKVFPPGVEFLRKSSNGRILTVEFKGKSGETGHIEVDLEKPFDVKKIRESARWNNPYGT
jgi:hypothetical protein